MSDKRALRSVHVAAVVVGAIVGVGIFFTPAQLARALPSSTWVLGMWILGGIVSASGALVFAELGARWPRAGGIYVFLREGFGPRLGPLVAFEYGWLQLLVIQPGSMGVIALVLVDHVAYLTGPVPGAVRTGSAMLAIAVFTAANLLGLRTGGAIQVIAAALKIGALGSIVAIGAAFGSAANVTAPRAGAAEGGPFAWLVLGLVPVLFSFGGAYHGTFIAGSVRDPEREVPRGILMGIAVVLVGYLLVNAAYLGLLGHDALAASQSPAADATALALGDRAGQALAVVIVLSAAGILNTVCLGFPFVIYAMAKDGLFFERAGRLDARTGRPTLAVLVQGALACAAILVGSSRVEVLMVGITFADAAFQGAVAIVLLLVRRTHAPPGLLRAPELAAWTFLLLELGLAVGCLVQRPLESAYGFAALVVGAGVFAAWKGAKPA